MKTPNNILESFTKQWKLMRVLELLLYAIGASILMYFLSFNPVLTSITFVVIASVMAMFIKPWEPNIKKTSSFVDNTIKTAEYSATLLLQPSDQLSDLAKLQQLKVSEQLKEDIKTIRPPHHLGRASIAASALVLIGLLAYSFNVSDLFKTSPTSIEPSSTISFQPLDSISASFEPPKITNQAVYISYPNYTQLGSRKATSMDVKAVEGSKVTWQVGFNSKVDHVLMESMGTDYPMLLKDGQYSRTSSLMHSGFYNFKFTDTLGQSYTSDLYAIEVIKDRSPAIEIKDLDQFTTFTFDQEKKVNLQASITDDFGIADAFIVATVSKGSGESVKFREEKLAFNTTITRGSKSVVLSKRLDLDTMNMEPGDELYFYVEASDLKQPNQNKARSETYFAVIKDTTSYDFAVEGTLGVDRMPDYFRSQRQLIIDTEKLIKNRKTLSKEDFNFKSNELGYDQKALRLKYGEFMGVETEEAGGGIINQENLESFEQEQDHAEDEGDDPLKEYTHDHDGDNEHNLVDEEGDEGDENTSKNPLQDYTHTHENSEMATLFEESLRSKLLRAMNEMWDSELYLRLYEPEKSLPYQYKALKLIQEIKNSARIYVHRIGFDPPPIKEDKRLTGKLEGISNYNKSEDLKLEDTYVHMKDAILRLEALINESDTINADDRALFELAGNALAILAVEHPGQHLKTLQNLKQLTVYGESSLTLFEDVQKGLLAAIPELGSNPTKSKQRMSELDQLLLKELESND